MHYKTLVASILLLTLSLAGCGGSSSSPVEPNIDLNDNENINEDNNHEPTGDNSDDQTWGDLGTITMTVSGAVTGEFSGMVDFHYMDFDDAGVEGASWEISAHDTADGSQSFSLTLSVRSFLDGGDGIARPEPGTYDIGFEPNSTEVFSAIFVHIGEGGFLDTTEFVSDGENHKGTLTITESSADTVSGTFVADLYWEEVCTIDGCTGDSVNITGEFTAHDRIF